MQLDFFSLKTFLGYLLFYVHIYIQMQYFSTRVKITWVHFSSNTCSLLVLSKMYLMYESRPVHNISRLVTLLVPKLFPCSLTDISPIPSSLFLLHLTIVLTPPPPLPSAVGQGLPQEGRQEGQEEQPAGVGARGARGHCGPAGHRYTGRPRRRRGQ